jgi:hypothetical protein
MKRTRKKSNRVKVSFAATILVLALGTIVVYSFSFGTPQNSVPSNLPPYSGLVGKYGPAGALQVTFDNFTAIRAVNASAVQNDRELIDLAQPAAKVYYGAVSAQVLVTLLGNQPRVNNSATVALLNRDAFAAVTDAFSGTSLAGIQDGQFGLYNVTDNSNGRVKHEWFTLVPSDSAVVFSDVGTSAARATVTRILSVWEGQAPSILSQRNVTRMLYSVNGPAHLALSIQSFTGQVLTSDMGVVAVDAATGRVQLSNVIRFSNSTYAGHQVGEVKAVYRFASDFSQYEECVKAVESLSLADLQQAVGLAGRG